MSALKFAGMSAGQSGAIDVRARRIANVLYDLDQRVAGSVKGAEIGYRLGSVVAVWVGDDVCVLWDELGQPPSGTGARAKQETGWDLQQEEWVN